jgi:hypothetical protein
MGHLRTATLPEAPSSKALLQYIALLPILPGEPSLSVGFEVRLS